MPDGSVSENIADVETRFSEYFTRLFSEGDPDASADALIMDLKRLPAKARVNLFKAASAAEEVYVTLRSMKLGSAPGPDGLPTEF
ncbi:hypothetical protein MRX96_040575 [Rhipicephalus microplus]